MPKVDLHIHSSVSDGVLSPAGIIEKAVELGLSVVSLTDHDNVDGTTQAIETAARYPSLLFIPGVEISTDVPQGEVHMLGYYIDHTNLELLAALDKMRNSRLTRAQGMIKKLADLGMPVEWKRVQELAGDGTVGRPHIAQALLENGHIETIKEAFSKYIAFGGPAYVQRDKLTPAEAVGLIIRADGIPVLAHPLTIDDPDSLVSELVANGLAGIEAYYKDYSAEERKSVVRLGEKQGLITTGGTDYHGLDDSTEVMMGEADVPLHVVDTLVSLAEKRLPETTAQ